MEHDSNPYVIFTYMRRQAIEDRVRVTLTKGATIGAVSALLGHSRPSTTVNVYYNTTKAETINAIGKLPALEPN